MPATRFRQNFVNRPDSGLAIELSGLSKTYRGSRGKPSHLALIMLICKCRRDVFLAF